MCSDLLAIRTIAPQGKFLPPHGEGCGLGQGQG